MTRVSPWLVALALAVGEPALAAPDEYRVDIVSAETIERGSEAGASLTIEPAAGRQVSRDGPLQIDLVVDPGQGLRLDRHRLRLADAADPAADAPRFEIRYAGEREGSYAVAIDLRFWICGARTCRPVRERRTVRVVVTAPPRSDGGTDPGLAQPSN